MSAAAVDNARIAAVFEESLICSKSRARTPFAFARIATPPGQSRSRRRASRRAIAHGLKLSEYGLFRGERRIAGATEESIYAALDVPWAAPEQRGSAAAA